MEIKDEVLNSNFNEVKSYLSAYEKYGAPLVNEYSKELDEKVTNIQKYLSQIREFNLDFDVVSLQKIVMELSTTIYFTNDRLEQMNLLADMAKVKWKESYNEAYTSKQEATTVDKRKWTSEQLRAIAEQESIEDELINFIYSHAASVLKGKIDSAYEVLKSCSKSLSAVIQSMQTFNVGQKHM